MNEIKKNNWLQEIGAVLKNFTVADYIALAFALFHIYTAIFGSLSSVVQRATHLGFAGAIAFLVKPVVSKKGKSLWLISIVLGLSIVIPSFYLVFFQDEIVTRFFYVEPLTVYQTIFFWMIIFGLLCATWRYMGLAMPIIALISLLYYFFGQYLGGYLYHSKISFVKIVDSLYLTTEGILGSALSASATYVIMFVIFGAFLDNSGVGKYFINFATSVTAKSTGGPAKAAVVSSCLFGSISGSAIANVATTGQITIPLMKRAGYPNYYAGAVEAVASTGGVITPPVMGAAAFVMSEFTGIPYIKVLQYALLPAVLYYVAIFFMVHYEAKKLGIKPLMDENRISVKALLKESYLFLPLVVLIFVLVQGFSPIRAVLIAMVATIIVSLVKKENRMHPAKILTALSNGAKGGVGVALTCATAGIVVGAMTYTGLGNKIGNSLLMFADNHLFLALFMAAFACVILGMGLPTTPSYIIVASLIAPSLVNMGVPLIAAHLFVFFFANISQITPPVALAAYTAAGLAESNPVKTGFTAFKLGMTAYIVPFMFAYNPPLLLISDSIWVLIQTVITAFIGIFALAISLEGFYNIKVNIFARIILFVSALLVMVPGGVTDLIGIAGVGTVIGLQYIIANVKKNKQGL